MIRNTMKTYSIKGFPQYIIKYRKLFRKERKNKHKIYVSQNRDDREIKKFCKDGKDGYWLIKYDKRVFVACDKLKKLVRVIKP